MQDKSRRERREEAKSHNSHKEASHTPKSSFKEKLTHIYTQKYKTLMIIPNVLLFLSFVVLFYSFFTTGHFIDKSVAISGGTSITISSTTIQASDLEAFLEEKFPSSDLGIRTLTSGGDQAGLIVETSNIDAQQLEEALVLEYSLSKSDYTLEVTGSSLGNSFYRQLIIAIIAAFILMGLVVYISYRVLLPSFAIILAAFSDMITTLAILSLFHVKLTPAGIAAFLMLIGYSVDTDVLLTTRVLREKEGTTDEKIFSALKTGMTMSVTAIVAVTIALILTPSDTIKQIMLILLIGLLFDIIYTWIQNVGLLKMYLEKKEQHK